MASTYTTGFGIEKIGTGEQAGAWGTTTNHNADIIDRLASYKAVALSGTTHTLTIREASPGSGTENLQDGMYRVIKFTGALGGNNTVTIAPNTSPAWFIVENATTDSGSSGPYTVILTQGSGANVTVQNGKNAIIYCDGAGSGAVVYDALADLQVGTLEVTGAAAIDGVTTHGGNVVSDTDSTDDLGTTSVRWANLFVDAITATDQITATGFTGTLDGILGSGTAAAASVTTLTTSGIASIDDTTDTTSGTSGSIHTDGGLGVAKAAWVGTNLTVKTGTSGTGVAEISHTAGGTASSGLIVETGIGGFTGSTIEAKNTIGSGTEYDLYRGITDSDGDGGGPFEVFSVRGDGQVSAATVAGGMLASKAEMEAASATDHLVSPGLMNDHPGMMKCWVSYNQSSAAILAEHNSSSVTDSATGRSTTVWDTDFSAATYATGGTALAAVANHGVELISGSKATTGCGYACKNFATNTDGDTTDLNIWAAGDQ